MNKVWVILFHLFWLTHPGLVTAADLSHHPFSQAYALFDEGKFTEAAPRFREALDQKDALEDYSLYFLGVIAFTGDSNEEARGYFSRLKKGFPRSVWLSDATFHLARIELREGKPQETIQLLKALDSKSVGEPLHTESLFLLGQTYQDQKDPKQAHAAYQRLRANYPLTPWAGKAKEEVQSLRAKFPELLVPKDPDSLTKEADILLGELDFAAAEKIFLNFPGRKTDKKLRFSYLTGLAEVYRWARRRVREKEILKEIVREYPQTSEASDAFYRIAEIQWNQGKNQEALKRFKQLQERYPQNSNVDHAEFARGRIFESLKVPSEAIKVYSGFAKKFPRSRWRVEAAWRLAWIHYLAGDYEDAHDAFKGMAESQFPRHFRTGARFWQGRTSERQGNREEAKGLYRQILSLPDDSYYKGPARSALLRLGERVENRKDPNAKPHLDATLPNEGRLSFHLARARKLSELSLHRFAVAELDRVRELTGRDTRIKKLLMDQYARNKGYDRSVILAVQLGISNEEFKPYRYPLAYWETIRKEASERDLDPYLVLALIRQESLFDPDAVSPASALGLMQLLPSTAGREAVNMGLKYPEPEKLFNPELNLRLGIHHLQRLIRTYPNSLAKALAAYNAGRRPVNRWEKRFASLDEEEFIERIPYRETRGYVKLVLRNYWIYKELYGTLP